MNGRPVADAVPNQRGTGRRQFVPAVGAIAALNSTPPSHANELAVSVITVGELQYGVTAAADRR